MSVFKGPLHSVLDGYIGKSRNMNMQMAVNDKTGREGKISVDHLSLLSATKDGHRRVLFPLLLHHLFIPVPVLWFPTPYRPTWQVPSTTDLMGCHFRPQVVILGWPDRSHPHDNIRTIYHVTKVIWIEVERVCQEVWIDDVLLLTRRKGRTKLLFWS